MPLAMLYIKATLTDEQSDKKVMLAKAVAAQSAKPSGLAHSRASKARPMRKVVAVATKDNSGVTAWHVPHSLSGTVI